MSRSMRRNQPATANSSVKHVVSEELGSGVDVNYNPEIINSALHDLEMQMKSKCNQIQKDADFMCTSIKQAFHLELIKLPNQVKGMSMSRFRSEFGDSLEAVTREAVNGGRNNAKAKATAPSSTLRKSSTSSSSSSGSSSRQSGSNAGGTSNAIFQTPSGSKSKSHTAGAGLTPGTAARKRSAKDGEMLMSANGSPLGEWDSTAVKPKGYGSRVPSTPSVQVPLGNGDVVDIDDADIDGMTADVKQDALLKMQAMMANMQSLMDKLQK
eukprot:GSChrysophyteH2.ASY1.ANO1.1527.1 assembled CDS